MAKKKTYSPVRNLAHLNRDKGYRFKDYRDPVLEEVCNRITDSGLTLKAIENSCGVSTSCMYNWLKGKTKRPQHTTVRFVLMALGYDFVIQRAKEPRTRLR